MRIVRGQGQRQGLAVPKDGSVDAEEMVALYPCAGRDHQHVLPSLRTRKRTADA